MPAVQGIYKFKREITLPTTEIDQEVNFTTAGAVYYSTTAGRTAFTRIEVRPDRLLYLYRASAGWKDGEVYNTNGWYSLNSSVTNPYANAGTIDFGSTPQNVSTELFVWLINNTERDVIAYYRGNPIVGINGDQSATIECAGSFMYDHITVKFAVDGNIVYNGMETIVKAGQTATIKCGGKLMQSHIFINATNIPTAGLDINGALRVYPVGEGETIRKGDFVTLVKEYGAGTLVGGITGCFDAAQIDTDMYVLAYSNTIGSSNNFMAVVADLRSGSIKYGNPVIVKSAGSGVALNAIRVASAGDGECIIGYRYDSADSAYAIYTLDYTTLSLNRRGGSSTYVCFYGLDVAAFGNSHFAYAYGAKKSGVGSSLYYPIVENIAYDTDTESWVTMRTSGANAGGSNGYIYSLHLTPLSSQAAFLSYRVSTTTYHEYVSVSTFPELSAPVFGSRFSASGGDTINSAGLPCVACLDESRIVRVKQDPNAPTVSTVTLAEVGGSTFTDIASTTIPVTYKAAAMSKISDNVLLLIGDNGSTYKITVTDDTLEVVRQDDFSTVNATQLAEPIMTSDTSAVVLYLDGVEAEIVSLVETDGKYSPVGEVDGHYIRKARSTMGHIGIASEDGSAGEKITVYFANT